MRIHEYREGGERSRSEERESVRREKGETEKGIHVGREEGVSHKDDSGRLRLFHLSVGLT